MRGGGNQADIAVGMTLCQMVVADNCQAAVLTGGTGVRLQGDTCETGHLGQNMLDVVNHFKVSFGLIFRHEGMDGTEFGPAERQHLRSGVQLHGAAAQRNHGAIERKVLHLQLLHVAHHLGFGMVAVEDRVLQVRGCAAQCGGDGLILLLLAAALALALERLVGFSCGLGQHLQYGDDVILRGGLVNADADALLADVAEIDMVLQSLADNHFALHRALYGQRVEEIAVVLFVAIFFKLLCKPLCLFVDSGGDAADTLRPVPGGIEAAHDGHQSLRGADV